jgi:hypothetical protein
MKVKIALFFLRKSLLVPQVCCRCASNPPYGYDQIDALVMGGTWGGKYKGKWTFKFPYCASCFEDLKRRKIFKGKARAVDVSNVMTKKYGKFLRKKSLGYVIFEFKNDRYGEVFKQANKELLLEKVLSELGAKEK